MVDYPAPFLSFDLYHRSMRRGAALLVKVLGAPRSAGELAAIARWFEHYRRACLIHAEGEDTVLWPALLEARPDLGGVVEGMDEEHAALHRVLDALTSAIPDAGRVDEARRLASELADLVQRHLDGEEAEAVPALIAAYPPERLGELIRTVQQNAGPEGAAVAIPFFVVSATDAERAAVLGALPPPVLDGYESSWRDAYDALRDALPTP
jgi:hemerythrin-like domain-containing protein